MAKAKKPAALGDQLRAAVEGSGQTMYRVAKESGVPQAVLGRFMAGERDIKLETANKLAAYLEMELTVKLRLTCSRCRCEQTIRVTRALPFRDAENEYGWKGPFPPDGTNRINSFTAICPGCGREHRAGA
jgi:transcriptional regulator with XRE-family HTH domain